MMTEADIIRIKDEIEAWCQTLACKAAFLARWEADLTHREHVAAARQVKQAEKDAA